MNTNHLKSIILLGLLFCSLSGCGTTQRIEALENYIGQNIDNIVLTKGVATSTFQTSTGSKIYEWKKVYGIIGKNCWAERLVVDKKGIVTQYALSVLLC